MQQKYCVFVDPYVSGEIICEEFYNANIPIIAVLTPRFNLSQEDKKRRFREQDYAHILHYDSAYHQEFLKKLAEYSIVRVIAGQEASVDIADQIAEYLTPSLANSTDTSRLRMYKFEMQEAVRKAGLNAIKQFRVYSPYLTDENKQELAKWHFPVVIKPDDSAGSIGVTFCESLQQIQIALENIIGKECAFRHLAMKSAVIQECLYGKEYFVDTVSVNGQHLVVSVHHYYKTLYKQRNIYRYTQIDECLSQAGGICIDYVKSSLNAVGLNNGFGHTELMLTPAPYLIEINPRPSGMWGMINELSLQTTGENQATRMALSITDPEKFQYICQQPYTPLKKQGRIISLQNWKPREIGELEIRKLQRFPSYFKHLQLKPAGTKMGTPEHIIDTVGLVLLVHPSAEQVAKDTQEILELEEAGKLF